MNEEDNHAMSKWTVFYTSMYNLSDLLEGHCLSYPGHIPAGGHEGHCLPNENFCAVLPLQQNQ